MNNIWRLCVLALLISADGLKGQQPPRDPIPPPIQHAADLSELTARTDEERVFAAIFDRSGSRITPDGTVDPRSKNANGDVAMGGIAALDSGPLTTAQTLAGFACGSDTFVGALHSRRVLLSKSETTLFTLATVDVERWFVPTSGPSQVVVAFMGGKVRIGADTYSWPGRSAPPDGRYVLTTLRVSPPSRTALLSGDVVPIIDGRLTIAGVSGKAEDLLAEMEEGVRVCTSDGGNRSY